MTRVLIADGHDQFRDALRRILERESDIDVVGQARDDSEVHALAESLDADVVLVDAGLPTEGGIETLRQLRRRRPGTGTVLLSVVDHGVDETGLADVEHLLKGVPAAEIVSAIRRSRPAAVGERV